MVKTSLLFELEMQNMAERSEYINSYYSGCCLYVAGDGMLLCGFIATILLYQEISLQFLIFVFIALILCIFLIDFPYCSSQPALPFPYVIYFFMFFDY